MSSSGMGDLQNRTLICSVLFIDIVEYSRKPVAQQISLKDRFNALLSEALRGVAVNDRIILDTGDGAAISFIGDPEDALFVATGLRDVIASLGESAEPPLSTRMGINLGPVRLVKDINGQPNIIGDGINVAQRVMTFARPGQVLVSRSYYEVVSRLSDESSKLFSYEGARTDKHIREHEVYAVGAIPAVRRRFDEPHAADWRSTERAAAGGFDRASQTVKLAAERIVRKPPAATILAVVLILGAALGARAYRDLPDSNPAASRSLAVTAAPPARTESPAPPREAPVVAARQSADTPPAAPAAELPPIRGLPPEPRAATPEKRMAAAPAVDKKSAPPLREEAKTRPAPVAESEPVSEEPATLSIAIAPWGEVYVDGRSRGVSPPLQEIELAPGRHRIEVRNSASQPHVVTINAKPGERLRIKHKFN